MRNEKPLNEEIKCKNVDNKEILSFLWVPFLCIDKGKYEYWNTDT